jgi:hypothetical protein
VLVKESTGAAYVWPALRGRALHSGIDGPGANVSGGHCRPLMSRQSKQCGGILDARQVRHVAGVGAAASAPHARPRGIRLDRRQHATSKPQVKTVPHKVSPNPVRQEHAFWQKRSIKALIDVHSDLTRQRFILIAAWDYLPRNIQSADKL